MVHCIPLVTNTLIGISIIIIYIICKIRDNPGMDRIAYASNQAINNANSDENKNQGNM